MADTGRDKQLSHQVTVTAARAGLWMIAGAVALFIIGVLVGLTLERRLMGEPVPAEAQAPTPSPTETPRDEAIEDPLAKVPCVDPNINPDSPAMRDVVAEQVRQILKLDETQRREVRAIIEKYNPRMQELRRRFEPELRKLALDALGDLRPILQPEQRDHLDRLLARHAKWFLNPTTPSAVPGSAPSDPGTREQGKRG